MAAIAQMLLFPTHHITHAELPDPFFQEDRLKCDIEVFSHIIPKPEQHLYFSAVMFHV